jgi:hypothetical protein
MRRLLGIKEANGVDGAATGRRMEQSVAVVTIKPWRLGFHGGIGYRST